LKQQYSVNASVLWSRRYVPGSQFAGWFTFNHKTLTILIATYGFLASVLPVWFLLSPRDYLSSIMKISVIGLLAVGLIIVAPEIRMPAFTDFTKGGGPIIPGKLYPYLFITIACGAISGFHSLVSSGTTPKMIMREADIKSVAVGSMLTEGAISIMALIAATSLLPLDYFQINIPVEKLQAILPKLHEMGFVESNLDQLSPAGETIAGRTGEPYTRWYGISFLPSRDAASMSSVSFCNHV
jgi:carbon starvation protein